MTPRSASSSQLSLGAREIEAFGEQLRTRIRDRVKAGYLELSDEQIDALVRIARLCASDLSTERFRVGCEVGRAEAALERAHGEDAEQ